MKHWRLLVITLFLSLAANAFFIGYGISQNYAGASERHKGGMLRSIGSRLTKNIEDPYRQQVMDGIEEVAPRYKTMIEERRETYRKLRDLLAAPQIDRDAVETVLSDLRTQSQTLQTLIQQQTVDVILELPDDQRARLTMR